MSKKQVSGPEAVRGVTRFACHWKAQNKLLNGLNKFYATAKMKVEKFINENPLASPEQYMTTPEGMMFKASSVEKPKEESYFTKELIRNSKLRSGELCTFTNEAVVEGIEYVMKNKIVHIFDKEVHNLSPLVERLGGEHNVVREVIIGLSGKVHVNEIFENLKINVEGFDVYVRGRVMNGIPKIGTFFIR